MTFYSASFLFVGASWQSWQLLWNGFYYIGRTLKLKHSPFYWLYLIAMRCEENSLPNSRIPSSIALEKPLLFSSFLREIWRVIPLPWKQFLLKCSVWFIVVFLYLQKRHHRLFEASGIGPWQFPIPLSVNSYLFSHSVKLNVNFIFLDLLFARFKIMDWRDTMIPTSTFQGYVNLLSGKLPLIKLLKIYYCLYLSATLLPLSLFRIFRIRHWVDLGQETD